MRFPISDELPNTRQASRDFIFRDYFAVDADSFAKGDEVRGDKKTGPIFLGATDRIDYRADRPLAVGAGHVNDARVGNADIQFTDQASDVFQPELDPKALKAVEPGERLSVLH